MAIGCAVVILQGGTFEEYVLKCGAVAGARLAIQGEPAEEMFAELPVAAELLKLRAELAALQAMTDEDAKVARDAEFALACHEYKASTAEADAKRARYMNVLTRLRAWNLPSPLFEPLKAQMLHEVETSMAIDCAPAREHLPVRMSPTEWRVQQIADKQDEIDHLIRTGARYAFMHALRASLSFHADPGTAP